MYLENQDQLKQQFLIFWKCSKNFRQNSTARIFIDLLNVFDVIAIKNLKNNRASGEGGIGDRLLKYGGKRKEEAVHGLIKGRNA